MNPDLEITEKAFLEAMAQGWATSFVPKVSIPTLPGSKAMPVKVGNFDVLDHYFVNPETCLSSGTTMIWHGGKPIWVMYYGGYYSKGAIPCLKAALTQAYTVDKRFYGGRGPKNFPGDDGYRYRNDIESGSAFYSFTGAEYVFRGDELCGHHWYRGMSLLVDTSILAGRR